MRRRIYIFIVVCLITLITRAAETLIVGDIVSAETGEPIANASVYYAASSVGTSTDAEGNFMLRADLTRRRTLIISAIGYHSERYTIEPGTMAGLQVTLRERTAILEEVVAVPGENPALPIIAAIRAARANNDHTLVVPPTDAERTLKLDISDIRRRHLQRRLWQRLQAGMVLTPDSDYILPLYTSTQAVQIAGAELRATAPKEEQAVILSTTDYSALLTIDGNYCFYNNHIDVLGKSFLSPLANAGALYYQYYLADSTMIDEGTQEPPHKAYLLHFRTKNPYYATFNGEMWVDSGSYAIRSIVAQVPRQSSVNYLSELTISQRFAADHSLMDEQLLTALDFAIKADTSHTFPTAVIRHSLTTHHEDAPIVPKPTAAPSGPLSDSIRTALMDSLEQLPLVRVAKWVATIATTGYIPTGTYVDIGAISELVHFTPQEKIALGLPLRTSSRLWQDVALEAAVSYGFGDQAWKGLGRIYINLPSPRRNIITAEYHDRYVWSEIDDFTRLRYENGILSHSMDLTYYLFKGLYSNRQARNSSTRQRQLEIHTENDWTDNLETQFYLRVGRMGYGPAEVGYHQIPDYRYQTLGGVVRLGWHERKVDGFFRRIHVYSNYPVLFLGAETGSYQTDQMSSYRMYGRLNLMLTQHVSLGMGGSLDYALTAGCVLGTVPYQMLYHFEGNQSYSYDPFRFTLMNNYQYAADRYLTLHAAWNGNGILFNLIPGVRYLRLRELITFKLAYGTYSDRHRAVIPMPTFTAANGNTETIASLRIPYVELGVGIGNILRVMDLHSVWRLTNRQDPNTPLWAMRFRFNLSL